jgi:hypothetical protein
MTRVLTVGGRAYVQAMAGLGVLMVVVLGSAAWLGRLLLGWSYRLRHLETALASSTEELPKLEPTGQRDLETASSTPLIVLAPGFPMHAQPPKP